MFLHRRCAHIEIKLQNHPTRLQFYTVFLVYWCHSGYAVLFSNISKFAFIYKSTTVKLTAVLLNKSPFHPPPCSSLSLSGAKLGSAWLKEGWSSLIHQKQVTHAHTHTHTHTHTETHPWLLDHFCNHKIPLIYSQCYFWILIKYQLLILPLAWQDIQVLISVLYSFTIKK